MGALELGWGRVQGSKGKVEGPMGVGSTDGEEKGCNEGSSELKHWTDTKDGGRGRGWGGTRQGFSGAEEVWLGVHGGLTCPHRRSRHRQSPTVGS